MTDGTTLDRLRAFLLGLFASGSVLVGLELWLADHVEDAWQLVPIVLLGLGFLLAAANARRPRRLGG